MLEHVWKRRLPASAWFLLLLCSDLLCLFLQLLTESYCVHSSPLMTCTELIIPETHRS